jgi:hypothetical protein
MEKVTEVIDDKCERVSGDPDAPGAGGTGVVVAAVEQEPAVGRFGDIEANEARCVGV